jgi:hypothetical protein
MVKIKQLIINILKIENIFYWIQSKFVKRPTWYKKVLCNDCWKEGACVVCGCDIEDMFNSDKPCPKGKWGNKTASIALRAIIYLTLFYILYIIWLW